MKNIIRTLAIFVLATTLPTFFTPLAYANTPTLTVYTTSSFASEWGPGPTIKQRFEQECNCKVNLVGLVDGVAIINRLKMEGKHSKADVILGFDNNAMLDAERSGFLAQHKVDLSRITALPNGWDSPYFVPFDHGYFAFVYDKNKLATPPSSLKELVEQRSDLKIVYQDPRTSTVGSGLVLWMRTVFGDKVDMAWQQLAKKTLTVTKGWSEAYNLFLQGEADMALSYTTSPAYHIIAEKQDHIAAANFAEGHIMQVELAAKVKASKQPELADQFMAFMLSDDFQSAIPSGNWMYPVTSVALPAGFEQLTIPTKILSPSSRANAQLKHWIKEWRTSLIRTPSHTRNHTQNHAPNRAS